MSTAAGIFGGNSDGGVRLTLWLDVMCLRCKHERAGDRKDIGGGSGCELVSRAIVDPYGDDIKEWSQTAPRPARFDGELDDQPWPVCMSYERRKKRSDAGSTRAPFGMDSLFDVPGAAK